MEKHNAESESGRLRHLLNNFDNSKSQQMILIQYVLINPHSPKFVRILCLHLRNFDINFNFFKFFQNFFNINLNFKNQNRGENE